MKRKYVPKNYWNLRAKKGYILSDERQKELALETRFLIKICKNMRPATILDVGCGDGRLFREFEKQNVEARWVLCDISPLFIELCREKTGVVPILWDGKNLPFESESFDLVISFDVMLHVPVDDIEGFWAEHVRVAKDKVFVATYIGARTNLHSFRHGYGQLIKKHKLTIEKGCYWRGRTRANWLLSR